MNKQSVSSNGSQSISIEDSQCLRIDYATFDDSELLKRIGLDQDRAALSELYIRYQLPVARFLKSQMQGAQAIEEVYNDVMLTVWKKAESFRGDSKVSTWLFGIAYRTRLAHYQKESRHNHENNDEFISNIASEPEGDAQTYNAIKESLYAALVELSMPHRAVIELTYFHGYSTTEIAHIVGTPRNTVKTRLFHARKHLKTILLAENHETQTSESRCVSKQKLRQQSDHKSQGQLIALPCL